MDKFVTVKKSSTIRSQVGKADKEKQRPLYTPYNVEKNEARKPANWRDRQMTEKLMAPLIKDDVRPSSSALTKHLLANLSDESNPITHSGIYERTDYVTSAASGHQRSDGHHRSNGYANQSEYFEVRRMKLKDQYVEGSHSDTSDANTLRNVRVYIDGYLSNTTDTEMKRIVTLAGGQILHTASGATHILTSQQLSGSKTEKLLKTKSKVKVHVVRPEWVTDCVKAGKRLSETNYTVIKESTSLLAFLAGSSSERPIELD